MLPSPVPPTTASISRSESSFCDHDPSSPACVRMLDPRKLSCRRSSVDTETPVPIWLAMNRFIAAGEIGVDAVRSAR